MKWHATHILKVKIVAVNNVVMERLLDEAPHSAPQRVMLNSGEFYTKRQWEESAGAHWLAADGALVVPNTFHALYNAQLRFMAATVTPIRPRGEGESSSHTPLRSEVTRITVDSTVRRAGKQRRLIVSLAPGDILVMREEGTRKKNARVLPLLEAWALAGRLQAQKLKADRKTKRKARRAA